MAQFKRDHKTRFFLDTKDFIFFVQYHKWPLGRIETKAIQA